MSERAGNGDTSWLPPELPDGEELADERTSVMAAAATASPPPASQAGRETSWLPPAPPSGDSAPSGKSAPSGESVEWSSSWLPGEPRQPETTPDEEPASQRAALMGDRGQAVAVEAYCREACPPETSTAAAAEVLDWSAAMSDDELLRHTRVVAAKHAVAPKRLGRRRGLPPECALTPGRLARRANDELDQEERDELERHLDSCITCQAAELRAGRAERAFAGIAGVTLAREGLAPKPPAVPQPELARALEPEAPAPAPAPPEGADAPTGDWIPASAPTASIMIESELATPTAAVGARRHRLPLRGVLAAAAAVAAAGVIVAVALSGGHSHKAPVAGARIPTPTSTAPAPTRHKAAVKRKPAVTHHHKAVKKPAVHHAAPAVSATPVVASATPTSSATSSAAVSQPSTPAPAPAPAPSSSSSSGSSSSSTPSVSISQGSLGSTSAKQGIGH